MAATGPSIEFESFDRLEDKVKMLVALVGQLRTDQARLADDNLRLTRDLDATRTRLQQAESSTRQLTQLTEERELIRTRVSSLLDQLDTLNL